MSRRVGNVPCGHGLGAQKGRQWVEVDIVGSTNDKNNQILEVYNSSRLSKTSHPTFLRTKARQRVGPSKHTQINGVTFSLIPYLGLCTILHIFHLSGSSTVSSISKRYMLNKQQSSVFISVSANFLPMQPLASWRKGMYAFAVYVSGKRSQRSGSKVSAVSPQKPGARFIVFIKIKVRVAGGIRQPQR